ncbi:hypothetical protein O3P69_012844 [Scylla paramamosain]|uniref:Uncharacterized protein n=1 Tax=Scylla paramamosain TaxID=85552 RepID=A0AAW0TT90_SCYPA
MHGSPYPPSRSLPKSPDPTRLSPYNSRPHTKVGVVQNTVGGGARGPSRPQAPIRTTVPRGVPRTSALPPVMPAVLSPVAPPAPVNHRVQLGRQPLPPFIHPLTPIAPPRPPMNPVPRPPVHQRLPAVPTPPDPSRTPSLPLHLTPLEAAQLARLLSDPLWRRHFLGAANRLGLADDKDSSAIAAAYPSDSSWMSGVGSVMGGVADSLPSLERAVTTMSFLAFGIFMTNLVVQAMVNTTTITSIFGKEGRDSSFSQPFQALPLDLTSFMAEEGEAEAEGREEAEGGKEAEETDSWMTVEGVKQSVQSISDVYLGLQDVARKGLAQVVGALGVESGLPLPPRLPQDLQLPPECMRRLLCEVHGAATARHGHTRSYAMLPFWTAAVRWLKDGDQQEQKEEKIPAILEDLRAEVAGQSGRNCSALFPACHDPNLLPFRTLLQEERGEGTAGGERDGVENQLFVRGASRWAGLPVLPVPRCQVRPHCRTVAEAGVCVVTWDGAVYILEEEEEEEKDEEEMGEEEKIRRRKRGEEEGIGGKEEEMGEERRKRR